MSGPLFCRNFYLTVGGSKNLCVGVDPKEDFKTFVYLYKSGYPKVQITLKEFENLCKNEVLISSYFYPYGDVADSSCLSISDTLQVRFDKSFVTKMVVIERKNLSDLKKPITSCWLVEKTWVQLVELMQCVKHEVKKMSSWEKDMKEQMAKIYAELSSNYKDEMKYAGYDAVKSRDVVKKLNTEDISIQPESGLDVQSFLSEMFSCYSDFILYHANKE